MKFKKKQIGGSFVETPYTLDQVWLVVTWLLCRHVPTLRHSSAASLTEFASNYQILVNVKQEKTCVPYLGFGDLYPTFYQINRDNRLYNYYTVMQKYKE